MTINHVSSTHNNAAHAPNAQPAKKPNVNFSDLMNAGMAVPSPAPAPAPTAVTSATSPTQTAKA